MQAGQAKLDPVDFLGHVGRFPLGVMPRQGRTAPLLKKCQFPNQNSEIEDLITQRTLDQKV